MKNTIYYFYLIGFLCLLNCGKTERVDTKFVKEALKEREFKKISNADITEFGLKKGKEDSRILLECHNKDLLNNDLRSCLDSNRLSFIHSIKIITLADTATLSGLEKDLFLAYQYNFTHSLDLFSNLQDNKKGSLIFTFPFFLKKGDNTWDESKKDSTGVSSSFGIMFIDYDKKKVILEL